MTNLPMADTPAPSHKSRSWRRWLLVVCFLILACAGVLRAQQSLVNWEWLVHYGAVPGPSYLFFSGAVWAILGFIAAFTLWFSLPWYIPLNWAIIAIYVGWYWLDRLVFSQTPSLEANTLFALGVTMLGLLLAYSELGLPFDLSGLKKGM